MLWLAIDASELHLNLGLDGSLGGLIMIRGTFNVVGGAGNFLSSSSR